MNRFRTFVVLGVAVLSVFTATVRESPAAEDAHVVGRLTGTIQPLPGYFRANTTLMTSNRYPEFLGYRFLNSQSGNKVDIRPDSNGYFSKALEPGTWVLERFRKDRVSGDVPKEFQIMTFDVLAGSLSNLGTIQIVLESDPRESLRLKKGEQQGVYIYKYGYERREGAQAYSWPIENLKMKDPSVLEKLGNNVVEISAPITDKMDGSKYRITLYDN